MLNKQSQYIEYSDKLVESIQFLSSLQISSGIAENEMQETKIKKLQKEIREKELIVPIAGGFSSGKSTLINSFLGSNILPTAIAPETALATELRYSEHNYIEAIYRESEKIDRYDITQFEKIKQNAQQYDFIRIYLNSSQLKKIQPLVLVDMPGFSSPIGDHTRAIVDYSDKASHFIFLTPADDGTIQLNLLNEIRIYSKVGKSFSFCLSKTNLRSPTQVNEIKEQIIETLEDELDDFDQEVILLDDNGGENLTRILTSIDPEALIERSFHSRLTQNNQAIIDAIESTQTKLKTNAESLEDEIKDYSNKLTLLEQRKQRQLDRLKQDENGVVSNGVEIIKRKVSDIIYNNLAELTALALRNSGQFTNKLTTLVRTHVETELDHYTKSVAKEITTDFTTEIGHITVNEIQTSNSSYIDDDLSVGEILQKGLTIANLVTLAIPTLAPVIKVVTTILTGLVNIFFSGNSSRNAELERQAQEEKQRIEVEQQISGKILKQILEQLDEKLPSILKNFFTQLIEKISNTLETQLADERNNCQMALNESKHRQDKINHSLEQLSLVANNVRQLAQAYL